MKMRRMKFRVELKLYSLDPDAPELPPPFKPDSTPPLPLPVYREIRTEIPTGDIHEDEKNEASCEIETISLDPDAPELPPPFKPDSTPPQPLPVYQEIHNEIPVREPNECTDNSALVVCSDTPSHPKPPLHIYQEIAELSNRGAQAKPDE